MADLTAIFARHVMIHPNQSDIQAPGEEERSAPSQQRCLSVDLARTDKYERSENFSRTGL